MCIRDSNLVEHLSGIAMHDALTQLPNRRYLESFLNYKLNEYKRFGRLFAVLFADIDDFSHFNNEYGHDTGDRVLEMCIRDRYCTSAPPSQAVFPARTTGLCWKFLQSFPLYPSHNEGDMLLPYPGE